MCLFEEFLTELYKLLAGNVHINNNIVKKQTRNADLSFPVNITNWHRLLSPTDASTIFEYSTKLHTSEINEAELVRRSQTWCLIIDKCVLQNDYCYIHLNRAETYRRVVRRVIDDGCNYGRFTLNITFEAVANASGTELTISEARLLIIRDVINRFLHFNQGNQRESTETLLITNKSTTTLSNDGVGALVCGPVLNKARKLNPATYSELHNSRCNDMRLMAEHKYGIRVKNSMEWRAYCAKLADAAIVIDMLQNRCTSSTIIDLDNHYTKDAAFIMYNYTRLSSLLNEFNRKANDGVYKELQHVECIDFTLLKEREEWELLYAYILQFPALIRHTIGDVANANVHLHQFVSFLLGMSSLFSVYYRRIKILIPGHDHLQATLQARIHLLNALDSVYSISFNLLGIEPIKKM